MSSLALLIGLSLAAGPAAPATTPTVQQRVVAHVAPFEAARRAVVGVSAVDVLTGQTLVAHRADEPLIPASNQKLLTSAFALVRLGADFRFATGVFAWGPDLVVAGEFDPTLGDPRLAAERGVTIYAELDDWAAAVRKHAGGAVRDVIVCEPAHPPGRHPDWPEGQHQRWYAVPVGTLNFNDNCFDVRFVQAAGGALTPVVEPQSRFLRVENQLRSAPPHEWGLRCEDDDATVVLTGRASRPSTEPMSVSVEQPGLLLGRAFAERLVRGGTAVNGRVRRAGPREVEWADARPVAMTTTPLFVVMRRACKRSLNLAAEAMFLRAGDGTWAGSAEMMRRTLSEAYDLPAGSLRPADGGGLSRNNRVTPAAVTKVLSAVVVRPEGLLLLHSLPVAGVDGTLARRFGGSPCRGRVLAKTGYIRGVATLSGYLLDDQSRPRVAFSILVNGPGGILDPARRLQEGICEVLLAGRPAGQRLNGPGHFAVAGALGSAP